MPRRAIQIAGLIWTLVYGSIIVWIYATEPRSFKDVATNSQVAAGTYEINQEKFNNGLALFRRDQFRAARDEWTSADPAQRDSRTQFYLAYACYREAGVESITTISCSSRGWRQSIAQSTWRPTVLLQLMIRICKCTRRPN